MAKAIRVDTVNNRTTGLATSALYRGKPATVAQQVHDGDTINVLPKGNVGVRLLGIDTPEVSFSLPGPALRFKSLEAPEWNEFLSTALSNRWGEFDRQVPTGLRDWLKFRLTDEAGTDHFQHASRATQTLRDLVTRDMEIMQQDPASFGYYMGFGFEVMDGYGRFLCTINRDQPKRSDPAPRPPTYNLRMLERGVAFPYFIWPNVSPWDRPDSVAKAVIEPGMANQLAEENRELKTARDFVRTARTKHLGIYDTMVPCALEPFELRFLSRRQLPSRYVMDLTSDSDELIRPEEYYSVPFPEDRLWIPAVYVPLFKEHGWKIRPAENENA